MSEERSAVSEPDTSSGDGAIHVGCSNYGGILQHYGDVVLSQMTPNEGTQRPRARSMSQDSLERLRKLFVRPPNFEHLQQTLRERRTVLVSGEYGTGRRSAAMMSLYLSQAESWRELPSHTDEDDEPRLDERSVQSREGLLLDLSSSDPGTIRSVFARLDSFRTAVAKHDGYLAIVLPQDDDHMLDGVLLQISRRIGRPDGRQVFENHLSIEMIEFDEAELDSPLLAARLESGSMEELARLAALVHRAKLDAPEGQSFADWLGRASDAMVRRAAEVSDWVNTHLDGNLRALCLAAATFEGASADAVFDATAALLKSMQYPEEESHLLERIGITDRLRKVGAGVECDRRVHFDALAYDSAVRTHFWTEFPDIRPKLRDWVGETAQLRALTDTDRGRLVTRFAEQCLNTERPEDLSSLAEQWTTAGYADKVRSIVHLAELALEQGLRDERYGNWLRRQVYNWARGSRLATELGLILVRLCSRVIAPSLPDQALVRLHHLARRSDPAISSAATEELVELAKEPRFFRRLLDRLSEELAIRSEQSDVVLFLRIVDPDHLGLMPSHHRPLGAATAVRAQLARGWGVVFQHESDIWSRTVRKWLDIHVTDLQNVQLLDVLVDACGGRTASLSRVYGVAWDWALRDDAVANQRKRVAIALTNKIDVSQDLEFGSKKADLAL